MALFTFKKKKAPYDHPPAPGGPPIQQVMMLRQQGAQDSEIIQDLQNQGYNSQQIYDALNQAAISGPQSQVPEFDPNMMEQDYGNAPGFDMGQQQMQDMPPPDFSRQQMPPPMQMQQQDRSDRIEELAEAIIDEKWKEITQDISKVIEWKEKTESRITKMEQQLLDLKQSIDSLNRSIVQKIGQYDQNLTDVGTEIKAMEKVFQNVLPSLTENVNRLERMSKGASSVKK